MTETLCEGHAPGHDLCCGKTSSPVEALPQSRNASMSRCGPIDADASVRTRSSSSGRLTTFPSASHAPAFFCATPACLRAVLAVLHGMLCALIAAGITHFCTRQTNCAGKLAAPGHIAGGQSANLRAVHVQCDTARHRFGIRLLQAGYSAVIAGVCASIAGVNTRFELLMCHCLLQSV